MEDILWLFSFLLALVLCIWLAVRRWLHPEYYTPPKIRHDTWVMSFLWSLSIVVGSIENLIHEGTYFYVGLVLGSLLTILKVMFRPAQDWSGPSALERG